MGRVNPVDATMAMARGAKLHGANIITGVTVTGVKKTDPTNKNRVTAVTTTSGDIECEHVVNCAGMWARQFGEICGVNIPLQAAEHYYLITEPIKDVNPMWPVVEDPASYGYYREEGGGLMVGLFEPVAAAWNVKKIPDNFSFGEIDPDWDRMLPYVEKAMSRIPATQNVGVKKFFCGPESFTADLGPLVGRSPEIDNYWVCAGLNSIGILTGPGMGRLLANWIINGKSEYDVSGINIDRMHKYQNNPMYRQHRVVESLGLVYKCHYPSRSKQTARGIKTSAIYERLKARGAYFRDVSGWEGADWYAPKGTEPKVAKLTWGRHNWFPYWKLEHDAIRNGVGLMDMSFMSKFFVQGANAGEFLSYISGNDVNGDKGMITYTQWLNEDGKMEADNTVAKLEDDKFLVVVTDTMHRHSEAWMRSHLHLPQGKDVVVTDVTGQFCQINLQGPRSRELLSLITSHDMSNESFPFRTAREIDIGYAKVLCIRITYCGELGYELYCPSENALHVYDLIVDKGKEVDLVHCGLKALSSLRMEKGYRDYGHDMDNTDTVLEVGLGFAVAMDKKGGFIGKEAVEKQKNEKVLHKRLVQVLCKDPEPMIYHGEVVWNGDKRVGYVRAGSYGHTLGGAVGLAMLENCGGPVTKKYIDTGDWKVEINGVKYPCDVSLAPMFDPKNLKIKA